MVVSQHRHRRRRRTLKTTSAVHQLTSMHGHEGLRMQSEKTHRISSMPACRLRNQIGLQPGVYLRFTPTP